MGRKCKGSGFILGHPYAFHGNQRQEMIETCNKLGLRFYVGAESESWYYPGHSLLVVVYAKQGL